MRNEQDKARVEKGVFREFAKRAGLRLVPQSIRKGDPDQGEPDILCEAEGEGPLAFELMELCAPDLARAMTAAEKTGRGVFTWVGHNLESEIPKKRDKIYRVDCPLELLLYTNGRAPLPDEVLRAKAEAVVPTLQRKFRRVWLLGSESLELLFDRDETG